MDLDKLLEVAKSGARKASEEILKIYESGDFSIQSKDDNSPLTLADKASHQAIIRELESTGLPILSEEGDAIGFSERKKWEYFWMIDPLDGTKEFIKKNGEFTVNIALIHHNNPILGVVTVPVKDSLYYAIKNKGAYRNENESWKQLKVNSYSISDESLRIVASRSHINDKTNEFINGLNNPQIVSMGSSLKLLAIAEGIADIYPRFGPTMEWDTAAAQIIVEEAGGFVLTTDSGITVNYNKEDLLNPHFIVKANES